MQKLAKTSNFLEQYSHDFWENNPVQTRFFVSVDFSQSSTGPPTMGGRGAMAPPFFCKKIQFRDLLIIVLILFKTLCSFKFEHIT